MSKLKFKTEEEKQLYSDQNHIKINTEAFYNEQQILKIWDCYIKTKNLRYFTNIYDQYTQIDSIFPNLESMSVVISAGILLNNDCTLFINDLGKSISICGPVNYQSDIARDGDFNAITNDLRVSLEQINAWNSITDIKIDNHDIIFPYHISDNHWCLGVLSLSFENSRIKSVSSKIYNPKVEIGGKRVNDSVFENIQNLIKEIFEQPDLVLVNEISHFKDQQQDGTSCGPISAENGKDIIDGVRTRFASVYSPGARKLRQQHLEEANSCPRFAEMQENNEDWQFHLGNSYSSPKKTVVNKKIDLKSFNEGDISTEDEDLSSKLEYLSFVEEKKVSTQSSAQPEVREFIQNLISTLLGNIRSYYSNHINSEINYIKFLEQLDDYYNGKVQDVLLNDKENLRNKIVYQILKILMSYKDPTIEHFSSLYDFKNIENDSYNPFNLEDSFVDFSYVNYISRDGQETKWYISGTNSIVLYFKSRNIHLTSVEIFQEIKALLKNYLDYAKEQEFREELLQQAARGEWVPVKKRIERSKEFLNSTPRDENGYDIYHWAADTISSLAEDSEDSESENESKEQLEALFWVIDECFKAGFMPTYNNDGCTVLHNLAYYQETPLKIALAEKIIKYSREEDLNCYDAYGKTPLLEAIERGNNQIAELLIQNNSVKVNIFRIEAWVEMSYQGYYTPIGYSAFQAANLHKRDKITGLILSRPDYKKSQVYIKPKPIYDDYEYRGNGSIGFVGKVAACGDVETMKMLIRTHGYSIFFDQDSGKYGWNILYIASLEGNVQIVDLLLNKTSIDKILGKNTLNDEQYKEFVNYKFNGATTALGRVSREDIKNQTKKNHIVRLFLQCPYVDVNTQHQLGGNTLLHNFVEENNIELLIALAQRPHSSFVDSVDFMAKDSRGNTPLRLACQNKNIEIIKVFIELKNLGKHIDFNEVGNKMPIAEILQNYAEEEWFGEDARIQKLETEHLIEIYRTGNPLEVEVEYTKEFYILYIECEDKDFDLRLRKKIERHIEFWVEEHRNCSSCTLGFIPPDWYDEDLGREISALLISEEDENNVFSNEDIKISVRGSNFIISTNNSYQKLTTEKRVIYYENLVLPENYDYKECSNPTQLQDIKEEALAGFHEPLLYEVIKTGDIELIKVFVECKDLELNPLMPGLIRLQDQVSSDIRLILTTAEQKQKTSLKKQHSSLSELKKESKLKSLPDIYKHIIPDAILENRNALIKKMLQDFLLLEVLDPEFRNKVEEALNPFIEPKDLAQKIEALFEIAKTNKNTGLMKEVGKLKGLLKDLVSSNFAYSFAREFSYNVALANLTRQSRESFISGQNRRLDALANILEGEDVCAAICFTGKKILISTNKYPDSSEAQKNMIKMTMEYFSEVAQQNSQNIELRRKIIFSSCLLNLFNDKNKKNIDEQSLISIISSLDNNYEVWSKKLEYDNEGKSTRLKDSSILSFKAIDNIGSLIDNGILSVLDLTKIIRTIVSVRKIENSIKGIDNKFENSFVTALKNKNYEIVGKEKDIHAEMEILDNLIHEQELDLSREYYIGISMLCCSHCKFVLNYAHNLKDGFRYNTVSTRGAHGFAYTWNLPDFVKSNFEKLFYPYTEMIEAYKKLNFIKPGASEEVIKEVFAARVGNSAVGGTEGLEFFLSIEKLKTSIRPHRAAPSISIAQASSVDFNNCSDNVLEMDISDTETEIGEDQHHFAANIYSRRASDILYPSLKKQKTSYENSVE